MTPPPPSDPIAAPSAPSASVPGAGQPSPGQALRERLRMDERTAMLRLTRGAVLVIPLTFAYMSLCWLLGVLPGTQPPLYLLLAGILFSVMMPLTRRLEVRFQARSWLSVAFICTGYLVCTPALLEMNTFTARAMMVLLALLTILWGILRQRPFQQLICGLTMLGLYIWIEVRAAEDIRGILHPAMVLLGSTCAVVQVTYLAGHVHRIRIALDRLVESLSRTIDRMEHHALHDARTGLPNRTQLRRLLQRIAGEPGPRAACLFEIDQVHQLSETLGETAGDELLRRVADAARSFVDQRSGEQLAIGRHGGPRFLLLMPDTAAARAHALVRQLRLHLEELDAQDLIGRAPLSAAFGLAIDPAPAGRAGDDAADLLLTASTALVQARQSLGERIVALDVPTDASSASQASQALPGPAGDARSTDPTGAALAASPAGSAPPSRIGGAALPWQSPFAFILATSVGMNIGYALICWWLDLLQTGLLALYIVSGAAAMAIGTRLTRVRPAHPHPDRARLAWLLMAGATPIVIGVISQIDHIGGRMGLAILNAGGLAAGLLVLNTRRYLMLAALLCLTWATVLLTRGHLGIQGDWPDDALLAGASCIFSISIAFLGGHIHAIRSRAADYSTQLRTLMTRMSGMSLLDELTGLPNRRGVLQQLQAQKLRAQREGSPLSICFADLYDAALDGEALGPLQYEQRVEQLSRMLRGALRETDIVGQLSPMRFLIVMPQTPLAVARTAADRMRERIEQAALERGIDSGLLVRLGVAQWVPDQAVEELLRQAQDDARAEARA